MFESLLVSQGCKHFVVEMEVWKLNLKKKTKKKTKQTNTTGNRTLTGYDLIRK